MKVLETEITNEIGELLEVLKSDAEFIRGTIEKLALLRELVVKRDDDGLTDLLENIRAESQVYSQAVKRRNELRVKIASALEWKVEEVRLSKLEPILPDELKEQVGHIRENLQNLSMQMKTELTGTASMLKDLSRFNSMVLNAILEGKQFSEITYSSSGAKKQQRSSGIVNMRL